MGHLPPGSETHRRPGPQTPTHHPGLGIPLHHPCLSETALSPHTDAPPRGKPKGRTGRGRGVQRVFLQQRAPEGSTLQPSLPGTLHPSPSRTPQLVLSPTSKVRLPLQVPDAPPGPPRRSPKVHPFLYPQFPSPPGTGSAGSSPPHGAGTVLAPHRPLSAGSRAGSCGPGGPRATPSPPGGGRGGRGEISPRHPAARQQPRGEAKRKHTDAPPGPGLGVKYRISLFIRFSGY